MTIPTESFLNELAEFLGEIVWRLKVNLGLADPDSKPVPINFEFFSPNEQNQFEKDVVDRANSANWVKNLDRLTSTLRLPEKFRDQVSIDKVDIASFEEVKQRIVDEFNNRSTLKVVSKKFKNDFNIVNESEHAGWLSLLTGYGALVRSVSFQELGWKRCHSPFDEDKGHNLGTRSTVWMKVRSEPPPPAYYMDDNGASSWVSWMRWYNFDTNNMNHYSENYCQFENVCMADVVEKWRTSDHNPSRWDGRWNWSKKENWFLDKVFDRVSEIEGKTFLHNRKVKIPSWWKESKRAYALRIQGYYETGYNLIWSAIMYCMQSGNVIPGWFRIHAWHWGCPICTKIEEKRNWIDGCRHLDGEKLLPQSIFGDKSGKLPKKDVDILLNLVKKYTPAPGSVDEILPYPYRRLIDWPYSNATGPWRPTMNRPNDWDNYITKRRKDAQAKSWGAYIGKVVTLVAKATSLIGSVSNLGDIVKDLAALIPAVIEEFKDDIADALGSDWTEILTVSSSLMSSAIKNFDKDDIGQTISFDNFRNVVDYMTGAVNERLIDSKFLIGEVVNSFEYLEKDWKHGDAVAGNVNKYFTAILASNENVLGGDYPVKAYTEVQDFLKKD